jgi:hypothetical protein
MATTDITEQVQYTGFSANKVMSDPNNPKQVQIVRVFYVVGRIY